MVICAMEKNKAEKNYVSGDLGGGEVINCSAIQLISCFNISGIYTYVFSITTVSKMFSEEHFFLQENRNHLCISNRKWCLDNYQKTLRREACGDQKKTPLMMSAACSVHVGDTSLTGPFFYAGVCCCQRRVVLLLFSVIYISCEFRIQTNSLGEGFWEL